MLPVYLIRGGVLAATSLFCLTLLTACENNAPPDQLTIVQGTVSSADTSRPLPGVLMGVESYQAGMLGMTSYQPTGDSVRTDAHGQYQLKFYNKKGLYYVVSLEPEAYFTNRSPTPLAFPNATQSPNPVGPEGHPDLGSLTLGTTNTIDFKPNELQHMAVRIRNRNTGYQLLSWQYKNLHGNNLDTTAYLDVYHPLAAGKTIGYRKLNAAGMVVKDTAVALVLQNPATLPPDTLRATLTFVR